jgi:glucose-6-phosphate 1-dehydrogenase
VSVDTAIAREKAATARTPEDHVIVLFGATGDLARRKLLPGMFHLAEAGLMPERFRIVGTSRSGLGEDEFRELAREAVEGSGRRPGSTEDWERFAASLRFAGIGDGPDGLREAVARAREELDGDPRLLHYLSLPPSAAGAVV